VVGQINAESGGQQTLRVEAENEDGIGFDEVSFLIDKPGSRSIAVARFGAICQNGGDDADYGNCPIAR
jgi:hypothetical protein